MAGEIETPEELWGKFVRAMERLAAAARKERGGAATMGELCRKIENGERLTLRERYWAWRIRRADRRLRAACDEVRLAMKQKIIHFYVDGDFEDFGKERGDAR